jgi:hypothetical protein
MTVICAWYSQPNLIIGFRYTGNWTIEECETANITLWEIIEPITARFDVIIDLTEAAYTLPIGILWHWKQQMSFNDSRFANWGINVYVTRNEIYEAYLQEGIETSDAVRKHCRIVKNVGEAIQIIQQARQGSEV